MSTIKNGLFLAIFFAVIGINFASAQNCSATLSVKKDRIAKSAYEVKETTFNMVLKNNIKTDKFFVLKTIRTFLNLDQ
jgi:hypothetical protein